MNKRLKQVRTDKGWSMVEMATRLGVTRQSVHAFESGKMRPSLETLAKLPGSTGVSLDWLILGKGK